MAYSWTNLVASAGQQNFAFNIPYLSRDHMYVYVNDLETNAYTFNSSTVIRLDSPASGGDTVRIQRITPIDEPIVDFNGGSALREQDLDASVLQGLYHRQEIDDLFQGIDGTTVQAAAAHAAASAASAAVASGVVATVEAAQAAAEAAQEAAEDAQAGAEAAATAAAESAVAPIADAVKGIVRMYRTGSGTWKVIDPDLNEIDISASTTDGLQEAIDYACDEGYDLHVHGGGIKPGVSPADVAVINCTTGIVFPPMQNKTIKIGACTVNFTGAVTGTGVFFDSCMMVDVEWNGQIVYTGNGNAVAFTPTNPVPYDLVTSILDSKFKFNHIATIGGTNPVCMGLSSANGPILGCLFEGFEFNGLSIAGSNGVVLGNATHGIQANTFKITRIHLCKGAQIAVGTSTTNQANIHSNLFEGFLFGASGGAAVGIDVFGAQNMFIGAILNNEGALTYGVHWESGAANNSFIIFRNNGSTAVQNDSGGATNKINFA